MRRANLMALCNYSLIPIACVALLSRTHSAALIVSVTGLAVLVCSLLFSIAIVRNQVNSASLNFKHEAAELLHYGIGRVPGDFGGGAVFALGPVIAAHYMPISSVSSLLLGTSVLMALAISAAPLGIILLSKVSMMLVQDRMTEVRVRLQHLLSAVLELSVFACLQVVIFADVLIRAWVGPRFAADMTVIRILSCAIPFYLFYVTFRTVVDAASVKAHNARNLLISLCFFLISCAGIVWLLPLHLLLRGISVALMLSVVNLGWLTARSIRGLYQVGFRWKRSARALALATTLSLASLMLHWMTPYTSGIVKLGVFELAAWGVYLGVLSRYGSEWMNFTWRTAFPHKTSSTVLAEAS